MSRRVSHWILRHLAVDVDECESDCQGARGGVEAVNNVAVTCGSKPRLRRSVAPGEGCGCSGAMSASGKHTHRSGLRYSMVTALVTLTPLADTSVTGCRW